LGKPQEGLVIKKPLVLFFLPLLFSGAKDLRAGEASLFEAGMYSSFGNTVFSMDGLFFNNGVIDVDIDTFSRSDFTGIISGETGFFVNLFAFKPYTLGVFTGMEFQAAFSLPREALVLIANEDSRTGNFSGSLSYGASAFIDAGLKASRKYGAWNLGLEGAVFFPLLYVPYGRAEYTLQTDPEILMKVRAALDLYTFLDLNGGSPVFDGGKMIRAWGFDLGASAGYDFSPELSFGGSVSHIPLIPAKLRQGLHARSSFTLEDFNYIQELINQDFDFVEEDSDIKYSGSDSFLVIRPMRIDAYAVYRPFGTGLVSIIPRAGLSFFTFYGYDEVFFNPGLEGKLNFPAFLVTGLGIFYREKVWSEVVSFSFTFKHLGFDFSLGMQGASLAESFTVRGFFAALGIRGGF
jgi:hypothetical protein